MELIVTKGNTEDYAPKTITLQIVTTSAAEEKQLLDDLKAMKSAKAKNYFGKIIAENIFEALVNYDDYNNGNEMANHSYS